MPSNTTTPARAARKFKETSIRTGRKSTSPLQYGNRPVKSEQFSDELDAAIVHEPAAQDNRYEQIERERETLRMQAAEMKELQIIENLRHAEAVLRVRNSTIKELQRILDEKLQATETAQTQYQEMKVVQELISDNYQTQIQSLEETCENLQLEKVSTEIRIQSLEKTCQDLQLEKVSIEDENHSLSVRIRGVEDELNQYKRDYESLRSTYDQLKENITEPRKEKENMILEQHELRTLSSPFVFLPSYMLRQELQQAKEEIKHLKGMRGGTVGSPSSFSDQGPPPSESFTSQAPPPPLFSGQDATKSLPRSQAFNTANAPATEFLVGRKQKTMVRETYEYQHEW
ncbi:hypothetical protein BT96DRAFT_937739 [Gymnopus androsaceus JB14]|uniref:Uncharacterized protein n=1 Tax=Gymnopus androsaceus JB14 TaxID=1447944 RepID=A0A6A4HU51_9AGAR|nr:hypothetical protein BT96DRAFT_937739 [Gymnopus androsaceus JB14]